MNREDWTKDITEAARRSFSDLLAQHGNESFYAFALYTGMARRSAIALNPPERLVDFLAWKGRRSDVLPCCPKVYLPWKTAVDIHCGQAQARCWSGGPCRRSPDDA